MRIIKNLIKLMLLRSFLKRKSNQKISTTVSAEEIPTIINQERAPLTRTVFRCRPPRHLALLVEQFERNKNFKKKVLKL